MQRANLGEVRDEGFGQPIREVFLLGIARQILQRQDRQRFNTASSCPQWPDEAVAAARNSLDKSRALSRVRESVSQSLDGVAQPLIEVHERVGRPDSLPQFFPT